MWPVQNVSNLWPRKIHLHAWRSATLIPFQVVSFWLNTLLPVVLPLFKAFMECLFANGLQLDRRVLYNVVSWHKSTPFQLRFQVQKQPKIARSLVGRVWSPSNHTNVVFGQESLNRLRRTSWYVVMMQLPRSRCTHVWSLALHSITKVMKDFQVVFFVHVVCPCDAPPHGSQRKRSIHTCLAFFGLKDVEYFHCDDCALVSGSYP